MKSSRWNMEVKNYPVVSPYQLGNFSDKSDRRVTHIAAYVVFTYKKSARVKLNTKKKLCVCLRM
jgi:monomeric isocitrate dehydrogenase